ncbi:hypothetical protein JG687_00016329 [Phytophthora cactorum]|uniref:Uncharacterized protein n=1 Tax=Phytophthora cactorum TaxID=29920 RepID=A0A8T1TSF9_9STRA|nr:hypothetical protein JG687_00016329 [Phytophthora cactorum]
MRFPGISILDNDWLLEGYVRSNRSRWAASFQCRAHNEHKGNCAGVSTTACTPDAANSSICRRNEASSLRKPTLSQLMAPVAEDFKLARRFSAKSTTNVTMLRTIQDLDLEKSEAMPVIVQCSAAKSTLFSAFSVLMDPATVSRDEMVSLLLAIAKPS